MSEETTNSKIVETLSKFKEWWNDDVEHPFTILSISYNPEKKAEIEKQNVWDWHNIISDKEEFASLLSPLLEKYFGNEYYVTDYYNDSIWLSQEDYENVSLRTKVIHIHKYLELNGYSDKNKFIINDLNEFLLLFIDYPTQFEVSPIILISLEKQAVIMIHESNTVVVALQNESLLDELRADFDRVLITCLKR